MKYIQLSQINKVSILNIEYRRFIKMDIWKSQLFNLNRLLQCFFKTDQLI